MYAPNLPEPWMIAELERLRRVREAEAGESARIPLYPPAPPPPARRDDGEPDTGRRVVIIQLG